MFRDRRDAGIQLAAQLSKLDIRNPVVIGLPRGGVVVAAEVARSLGAPLDIIGVRKLGTPGQPELAMGAIAEEDVTVYNESVLSNLGVIETEIESVIASEKEELARRISVFRGDRPPVRVEGRTAILIDDGLATGMTAVAASRALRKKRAGRIVLAVPVSSRRTAERMADEVDEVLALFTPETFFAIGEWFTEFGQTTDDEVIRLLQQYSDDSSDADGEHSSTAVVIPAGGVTLAGDLTLPPNPQAVVVFAHGSGSSRLSPRNQVVAQNLNRAGLATLLFDLLTDEEARDRRNVFDISLLAERLSSATRWLDAQQETDAMRVGYFGASTGAAAALVSAAREGEIIGAVVSRGGRPDLAGDYLAQVRSPTLLIVGGDDVQVVSLNELALTQLHASSALEVIPGATHLFEEPGALEEVTRLAGNWFQRHLTRSAAPPPH